MSAGVKSYWALVLDLSNSNAEPKVVPANDLYRYFPNRVCRRYKPRSANLQDKNEEFGVIQSRDDKEVIVKHHIVALKGSF